MVVLAETLESGAVQLLLSRRIGHRDNQAGTLLQRLAVEVYGPVLGYELPLLVTEGMAMMALPPFDSDAPYTKSIWPPTPE